jgi:hypothetical protein
MERRKESRICSDAAVTVTALQTGQSFPARVVNLSGSGVKVEIPASFPCGTAVKIEGQDFLLLGEICRLEPRGAGFFLGIQVSHSLQSLADLARLNHSILGTELVPVRLS